MVAKIGHEPTKTVPEKPPEIKPKVSPVALPKHVTVKIEPKAKVKPGVKIMKKAVTEHKATAKIRAKPIVKPRRGVGIRAMHTTPVTGGGGTKKPTKKQAALSEKDKFLWAEGEQESGNNYAAVNPNSGALGRWQVMPSNLSNWLTDAGQPQMSSQQFLNNHKAQDAVASTILGGYYDEYGPKGAAAMWYSGQPNYNAKYGDPPVYQYVDDVIALMGSPNVGGVQGYGTATPLPWSLPAVTKTDSWSAQVSESAKEITRAGSSAYNVSHLIRDHYQKASVS